MIIIDILLVLLVCLLTVYYKNRNNFKIEIDDTLEWNIRHRIIKTPRECQFDLNLEWVEDLPISEWKDAYWRSIWIDSEGKKYYCQFARNEPMDHHGRFTHNHLFPEEVLKNWKENLYY